MTSTFTTRLGALVRNKLLPLASLLLALAFAPAHAVDVLDGDEDFTLLSSLGFEQAIDGPHADGTRKNDYAWSMAWFRGKLLVGTGQFEVDPATGQPGPGQIWAYTPAGANGKQGTWAKAYESPYSVLSSGPREFGYRWMTQCTIGGRTYLFISTLGVLQGNILWTTDGVNFNAVSRLGFPSPAVGFRTMVCFTEASGKTTLITTPVGQFGTTADTFDSDRADNPIVLANDDPAGGSGWRNYSAMRMGDPDNNSFFAMTAWNGWLYAGVSNEITGAQVWRTQGCASPRQQPCMPNWQKLIDKGGGRAPTQTGIVGNKGFSDMIAFNGALYLAVSSPALDGDRIRAELWRMRNDLSFEVLVGEPRLNFGSNAALPSTNPAIPTSLRCGVPLEDIDGAGGANDCAPTLRRGAGWGVVGSAAAGYPNGPNLYFWRTFTYDANLVSAPKGDNRLYVSTLKSGRRSGATPGFALYATSDGVNFANVTDDGLGYAQQQGMRSWAATPYGLAVGGTHFPGQTSGTDIRGCNVWLGVPVPDGVAPVTTLVPPSVAEGATLDTRTASFAWTATDGPGPGSLPLSYAYRLDPLEPTFSAFAGATNKTYTNLPDGAYTFYVIARDNAGNVEKPGAAPGADNRAGFTVAAPNLPPAVTITVAPASPNTTGTAQFSWSGSDDLTPPSALVYDTWLAPLQADPGTFAAGTSRTYTGLVDGAYTFHVIAKDTAGNVSPEATASFTVAIPPGPPASPAPAAASITAPRTVQVTWTDVGSETSYVIERCIQAARTCTYAVIAPNVAANTTQYVDALASAGVYVYRVKACNAGGCSGPAVTNGLVVP